MSLAYNVSSARPDISHIERPHKAALQSLSQRHWGRSSRRVAPVRLNRPNLLLLPLQIFSIADAVFEQPHMIRGIRGDCGCTPERLGRDGEQILRAKTWAKYGIFAQPGNQAG